MTVPWTSDSPAEPTEGGPSTTIIIRNIAYDDQDAVYDQTGTGADTFTDYQIVNRYYQDPHTYMAGISSPLGFSGASVAFFQLAASTTLWIADWTACKLNSPPESPDPTPTDSTWVFLGAAPEVAKIEYMGDGFTPIYRVSGIYVYGKTNPSANVFNDLTFPRSPEFDDARPRLMPLDKLKQGFINQTVQGQGGGVAPGQ